ncbi:8670_t:CDS:2, partial [Racocetra persica]
CEKKEDDENPCEVCEKKGDDENSCKACEKKKEDKNPSIEYSNSLSEKTIKDNLEYEVRKISTVIPWEELKFTEKIGQGNF